MCRWYFTGSQIYERVDRIFIIIVVENQCLMKQFTLQLFLMVVFCTITACHRKDACCDKKGNNGTQADSLKSAASSTESALKPRLSELMFRLHRHHAAMWSPGIGNDWKLADYELAKLRESLADIGTFYGAEKYATGAISGELEQLNPALESLKKAVELKNKDLFVENYLKLTQQCNDCHKATSLDFYKVIMPATPAYSGETE